MRPVSSSISCSMRRRCANTDMHSAKTVRPESARPSCGKISRADALGPADRAVVEAFGASQNLQQRGFAGAVRAHQSHPVARRDHPVRSFEQELVAIAFAGGGELEHSFNRLMRELI